MSCTVAGDAVGLAPSRLITSSIYEMPYLLITSEQGTSPDSPLNGVKALPKVGNESYLGSVEQVFQTSSAHRREFPADLSPAWPSALLIPQLAPQAPCPPVLRVLPSQLHQTSPPPLCPIQSLTAVQKEPPPPEASTQTNFPVMIL